jgi:hypothetical protein
VKLFIEHRLRERRKSGAEGGRPVARSQGLC